MSRARAGRAGTEAGGRSHSGFVRQRAAILILIGLAVVAVAVQAVATPNGLSVSPDSVAYLATANNLAHGRGASAPYGVNQPAQPVPSLSAPAIPPPEATTHFPPLYSVALAPFVRPFGLQGAGRVVGVLCLLALMLLAGWIPYLWSTDRRALWLGPLLIFAAPDLLEIYVNLESEALFLVLVLPATFFLARYLERPSRTPLVAAALLVAAGVLTRYAGLGLIPGGALLVLLNRRRELRGRIVDAALFAVLSTGPAAVWLLRNAIGGSATDRTIRYHPPSGADVHSGLNAVAAWVSPTSAPLVVKVLLGAVVAVGIALLAWRTRERTAMIQRLVGVLVVAYVAGVIVSDTLVDATTGIDARILSPVHLLLIVGVAYLVSDLLTELSPKLRLLPVAVVGAVVLIAGARGGPWLRATRHSPPAYADASWRQSPFLAAVRALPTNVPIFTNAGDAIWFIDRRGTYPLPEVYDPRSELPNHAFHAQLVKLAGFITARHAVVAVFTKITWRPYLPSLAILRADLPVRVAAAKGDGVILGLSRRGGP
jgi:hypothetical protein